MTGLLACLVVFLATKWLAGLLLDWIFPTG